jgi:hypothetical protein
MRIFTGGPLLRLRKEGHSDTFCSVNEVEDIMQRETSQSQKTGSG